MRTVHASILATAALLAGCAAPAPTPVQVAVRATETAPPTTTPVPSATPTIGPANQACVRGTTEISGGQNPTLFMASGPASGCYESVGDFLDDIGLTWGEFLPDSAITFWTLWPVDAEGAVISPTATPSPTSIPQPSYVDTDQDGLSDANERIVGTDVSNPDTDGDGLSDYNETTKYFTNPMAADSDGDGVNDNDGNERREYGYTLKATIAIRPPSRDVQAMNDHFQDVTLVQDTGDELILEVVFHANAYHILERSFLSDATKYYSGLEPFLAPTALLNFDAQMSADARALFVSGTQTTDLGVVENMYAWERKNVTVMPGLTEEERDRGWYPEPFLDLIETPDGRVVFPDVPRTFSRWGGANTQLADRDWQMSHLILGKEMLYNRTHGSCGSTANFHCTILRSLGIPTRVTQLYPVLDPDDPAQQTILNSLSSSTRTQLLSRLGWNHFVCEAFIGNRWVRINNKEYETSVYMGGCFTKIASFPSWQEVDFPNSHGYPGDPPRRPYRLIQIEEQTAMHESTIPRLHPTSYAMGTSHR